MNGEDQVPVRPGAAGPAVRPEAAVRPVPPVPEPPRASAPRTAQGACAAQGAHAAHGARTAQRAGAARGARAVPWASAGGGARAGHAIGHRGLALRFVLIIGDERLAEAHHVSCNLDTVRAEFPETSVRIGLSPLPPGAGEGLVLDCSAEYRPAQPGSPEGGSRGWQRVLTGRPGGVHQRELLLRELLAARNRAPDRWVISA